MTQQAFADFLGISQGYLKNVEVGKQQPSFNFIMALIKATNYDANWILKGEENADEKTGFGWKYK